MDEYGFTNAELEAMSVKLCCYLSTVTLTVLLATLLSCTLKLFCDLLSIILVASFNHLFNCHWYSEKINFFDFYCAVLRKKTPNLI